MTPEKHTIAIKKKHHIAVLQFIVQPARVIYA